MHLILSYDKSILPQLKLSAFQHEAVADFYPGIPNGLLREVSIKDFPPNELCNYLEKKQIHASSVVIISDGNLIGYNESIRLACHIRFHPFSSGMDQIPVFLVFNKIPNPIFDKSTIGTGEIQDFQYEDGFYFIDSADLSSTIEDEAGQMLTVFEKNFNETIKNKNFHAEHLKTIKILPSNQIGNHEISNLWGAVNLARNAGYADTETGYDYPPTLYFKYLSKKYKANTCSSDEREKIISKALLKYSSSHSTEQLLKDAKLNFSSHKYLKNKRILLIDDNANKGWKSTLSLLFNHDIDVFSRLIDINLKDYKSYDLVFLDLYMPNPINDEKTDMAYTKDILKELKTKFPGSPIIAFTASNKSWTMNEVFENGADGIYVKESPEYAADPSFSKENFKSFVNTVIHCLEKYSILRPYWAIIEQIRKDDYFLNLPEKKNTVFKERIIERLEMFYGLLKKGFEQRQYDKERFHFSDHEMAFMTLWSILNEISELNFLKNDNEKFLLTDKNGKEHTCVPIPSKNWKLVSNDKYFLKHDFDFDSFNEDGSPLKLSDSNRPKLKAINPRCFITKNKTEPFYSHTTSYRGEASLEISLQIAFILMAHFNIPEDDVSLISLNDLNTKRNKLFLTHGSTVREGFYSLTEAWKRNKSSDNITPQGSIKELFELIAFLLTGNKLCVAF